MITTILIIFNYVPYAPHSRLKNPSSQTQGKVNVGSSDITQSKKSTNGPKSREEENLTIIA